MRRLPLLALPLVLLATALTGCTTPELSVRVVRGGLSTPWDLTFADGLMYVTEKGGRISRVRTSDGQITPLQADLGDVFSGGESGLMGIVADPEFTTNRRLYTCLASTASGQRDIRVVPFVAPAGTDRLDRQAPLITGLPVSSGRHGGCRLRFGRDGSLWVGTGDAAIGTVPQDLTNLGGKILRVDKRTGEGVAGNPFLASPNANTRRIWSWGHRNTQGLALRSDGRMWTVEHGPGRDDEVNVGLRGNFGWDPVPGYNESVPMTDTRKFPDAVGAAWSSGGSTIATSGATWLAGGQWEAWDGRLAVATLKSTDLRIMSFDSAGRLLGVETVLDGAYGRLRTAQLGPNGRLYLTTSNGSNDRILEVTPG